MVAGPTLITDADISGVLKNVYESYRINAFPIATPLMAQLRKGKTGGPENMRWGGNGVYWDVVLTRPVGMTSSPGGFFPPTAKAIERQANVGIQRTYVRRQIDALAIQGTKEQEAAFIPLVRKFISEALDAARLGQQEVLHGDGQGIKAEVNLVNSTTSIQVSNPYGIGGSTVANAVGRGGLLLDVGMFISVNAGATTTSRGTATISAVSNVGDQCTLTLDTAIASMASGDVVVSATTSDNAFGNYPNGLTNLLNRGAGYASLHGITQASFARWNTTQLVAGTDTPDSLQPSEMDVWTLAQFVAGKSGKDAKVNPGEFLLQTTPGIQKRLAESFLGQRMLTPADFRPIKGGYKAIDVFGLPLIADYWNPGGTLYLVHLPSLAWVDRQDWVKLSFEGSGPWRFIAGQDAYEINFGSYWNTAVLNRIAHGMITGYSDTVRYDHTM